MNVPFLDLKSQYLPMKDEIHQALDGWFYFIYMCMICVLVIEPCQGSDSTLALRVYDKEETLSLYTNNLRVQIRLTGFGSIPGIIEPNMVPSNSSR